jgi:putative oxidoreductase
MAQTLASDRRSAAATDYSTSSDDAGKLLLRVAVGLMMLLHGIAKMTNGVDSIEGMLEGHGLPAAVAYGAYVGEVIAPLFVIVGLFTRPAALVMAVNMLFAIGLAHADEIFQLGKQGGWALELQGLFLFGSLAIALLGAGRLSFGGLRGRWN